ncbi:hypothetical protein ACGFN1_10230 [Streptomyces sp. NPDC048685]
MNTPRALAITVSALSGVSASTLSGVSASTLSQVSALPEAAAADR